MLEDDRSMTEINATGHLGCLYIIIVHFHLNAQDGLAFSSEPGELFQTPRNTTFEPAGPH